MYVGLAWHFWNTRWRTAEAKRGLRAWERVAILAPLALHGWLIYRGIFAAPELRFGFAQALSVMMFLGVILYWIESLFFSLVGMQPLVLGGAGLCVAAPSCPTGSQAAACRARSPATSRSTSHWPSWRTASSPSRSCMRY